MTTVLKTIYIFKLPHFLKYVQISHYITCARCMHVLFATMGCIRILK